MYYLNDDMFSISTVLPFSCFPKYPVSIRMIFTRAHKAQLKRLHAELHTLTG